MCPIAVDPEATFDVVLESDKGKDRPPTFVFRQVTCRKWRELAELADQIETRKLGTAVEGLDVTLKALRSTLIGWRDMAGLDGVEIPFDAEKIEDLLTMREVTELMYAGLEGSQPTPDELKNWPLPPGSDTAASAEPVPADQEAPA